ncbi:hypothetical protein GM658_14235 [Pseudoduganella eburnea]|uniref:Uncharacterized protein n=1 Tax=Massilia eburnea TaxID=1776165 RepID=A0A6L6QHX0_9BURK|nr:hypothetical protein [Massilia eburnea]MTW11761.1 hypothetical protein [Massilia eburnea]
MDFVEVHERSGAVHAKILVEYIGLRQQASWLLDGAWIEYPALSAFEEQLRDGEEATLIDMSDYVVLTFFRESSVERLLINPPSKRSSTDGALISLDLKLESGAMRSFNSALAEFPKWW